MLPASAPTQLRGLPHSWSLLSSTPHRDQNGCLSCGSAVTKCHSRVLPAKTGFSILQGSVETGVSAPLWDGPAPHLSIRGGVSQALLGVSWLVAASCSFCLCPHAARPPQRGCCSVRAPCTPDDLILTGPTCSNPVSSSGHTPGSWGLGYGCVSRRPQVCQQPSLRVQCSLLHRARGSRSPCPVLLLLLMAWWGRVREPSPHLAPGSGASGPPVLTLAVPRPCGPSAGSTPWAW